MNEQRGMVSLLQMEALIDGVKTNTHSAEDAFEQALQHYEQTCAAYKIAQNRYIDAVGILEAHAKFDEAVNRICRIDSPQAMVVTVAQDEVNRRAKLATPIVDADEGTP
jgi:enamine deaminase RidA (YjgF/YER057c/UK114 family)